jgi:DNA-binding response OmpR family regulator
MEFRRVAEADLQDYEFHFARAGFEVCSVGSLGDALECAAQIAFDAVIADVGLDAGASVNGLALVSHVRSRYDQVAPAVVLTAYGWLECVPVAATLCVDIFLHKPVSLAWLEGEIRTRIVAIRERRAARTRHRVPHLQLRCLRGGDCRHQDAS